MEDGGLSTSDSAGGAPELCLNCWQVTLVGGFVAFWAGISNGVTAFGSGLVFLSLWEAVRALELVPGGRLGDDMRDFIVLSTFTVWAVQCTSLWMFRKLVYTRRILLLVTFPPAALGCIIGVLVVNQLNKNTVEQVVGTTFSAIAFLKLSEEVLASFRKPSAEPSSAPVEPAEELQELKGAGEAERGVEECRSSPSVVQPVTPVTVVVTVTQQSSGSREPGSSERRGDANYLRDTTVLSDDDFGGCRCVPVSTGGQIDGLSDGESELTIPLSMHEACETAERPDQTHPIPRTFSQELTAACPEHSFSTDTRFLTFFCAALFASGLLFGLVASPGPPAMAFLAAARVSTNDVRAVYGPIFFATCFVSTGVHALQGTFIPGVVHAALFVFGSMGFVVGKQFIRPRITPRVVRIIVFGIVAVSGIKASGCFSLSLDDPMGGSSVVAFPVACFAALWLACVLLFVLRPGSPMWSYLARKNCQPDQSA
ncbi:hypothetical protein DIPPA_13947 [Diplonema papillatum]|nr:hypothetical protein DIPPA_13947 [Diplonema papillatum]